MYDKASNLAYLIGVAVGDGNISNPNGTAYRLRVTCDNKYPEIIENIKKTIRDVFPKNKLGIINRKDNCVDISIYSNLIPEIFGWSNKSGGKIKQKIKIPNWIKENSSNCKSCLKGLFETDGCIYFDRGYKMINFVNHSESIINEVCELLDLMNINYKKYKIDLKYTIRITTDSNKFQKQINFNKKQKPKIIVVLGPTASGKSDLAVELAKELNGEIISADSRQVYKGLDIGSGKITKEEMRGVPHYLLDVADPKTDIFSVADFQKIAYEVIDDILSRNKLPIICGGTAFYIQSIVDGIVLPEIEKDDALRNKLEKMSLEDLQNKLKKLDPNRYSEIDTQNKVRLIRAIEISSQLKKVPKLEKNPKYEGVQIGLKWPKEILHQRIHDRLIARAENGMIEEVQNLHDSGVSWERLEELGLEYRYIAKYLKSQKSDEEFSKEEMLETLENKIRQFSKRQMTWWKKDERIEWFQNL